MIEASGCIFLSTTTGRIMMQLRSDGVTHARKWGFFGGKSENKERPSETLYREIEEEVGKTNITKVIPISKFTSKNGRFIYNSFVVLVAEEFIPDLNKESDGYCWVAIEKWPRPLHPGAKIQCNSKDFLKKVKTIYDLHR
jgi:8-oxo-dGTP pyrophosphatase MutT (NUDIX family)|tara:strand:- start:2532 stop:2951 length:420 start_codon:yes stop_codon:yes gene_type:complete